MANRTPAPNARIPLALVEPATLLGKDIRAVLVERDFPSATIHLFQSHAPDGLLAADGDEAVFVAPLVPDALETCRIAFFCGRAEDTRRFLATRTEDGCLVIDLSGVRAGGPFAAPAAEGGPPLPAGDLLLTYDPTAAVLAEAVRVVDGLVPVEGITAAIDRPASELGAKALDELFQQAIALAAFRPMPKEIFDTQSAFNFFHPADSADFEARVAEDFQRLFGREVPIALLSARAGVFHGHHLRVEVRTTRPAPSEEAVRAAFRGEAGAFEETDPENLSGPVESASRDETQVLRVSSSGRSVRLGLAADHLRRAGAVMAVRLAEQAARERGMLADA